MRIWKIEGHDLDVLRAELAEQLLPVYCVRIYAGADKLLIKVNEGTWSLGLGEVEAER